MDTFSVENSKEGRREVKSLDLTENDFCYSEEAVTSQTQKHTHAASRRNFIQSIKTNLKSKMFVSKIECRSAKSSFELSRPSWNLSETPAPNELESLDNSKLLLNFPSPLSAEKKKEMSEMNFSRARFSGMFNEEIRSRNISSLYFINNNFSELYEVFETLGEGCSGIVKRCRCTQTGKEYAVKITNTKSDEESMILHLNEFSRRKTLSHRNIVSVHEMYIDCAKHKIYTVMDLAQGEELQKLIEVHGRLNETLAAKIFKQIALGIQYLHKNGVCHRDLKPENILVSEDGESVKIIDFNVSKFNEVGSNSYSALSKSNYKMWTYTGTLSYLAPEMFKELEYTELIDSWSAGVILYLMLAGSHPFQAELKADLIEKITAGLYEMNGETWDKVSEEAKDLVENLLQKKAEDRYTPFQILAHPWILNVKQLC